MDEAAHEIEIKLPFDSAAAARSKIEALGAREVRPRIFEDNVLYDRAVEPLKATRRALRLRRVGPCAVLTYKAPVAGEQRYKVRIEHESEVRDADAVERILSAIGFEPRWRYQKYRTEFELDGLHLCLDETPLGCFLELEGAPEAIDRVAGSLGFGPEAYVRASYRRLCEQDAAARGVEPGDVVFEEA